MVDHVSGAGIGASIGSSIARKRLARRGRVLLGVRSLDGASDAIRTKWSPGFGDIGPGQIGFIRTPGGLFFIKRPAVPITVWEVGDHARRRTFWETWWTPPDSRVIAASTSQGRLELAIPKQSFAWVAGRLGMELPEPPQ